jgi:hypothetical protein
MKTVKFDKRFELLIATMNVPQQRKKGTAINAMWFLRSGGIANRNHRHFYEVCDVAMKLANNH